MNQNVRLAFALGVAIGLAGCTGVASAPVPAAATATPTSAALQGPALSGERLTYVVGCVHCHHQLPKQIMNAPGLVIAKDYSLPEFRTLLSTGVTRDGRDLYALQSAMGFTAREQLAYLTDEEVAAIHEFLQQEWTVARAATEEAKIPPLPGPPPAA